MKTNCSDFKISPLFKKSPTMMEIANEIKSCPYCDNLNNCKTNNKDKSIIISIKPQYVQLIKQGIKKFEYRKSVWKNTEKINKIYIYESRGEQIIIGYFIPGKIIADRPTNIWEKTQKYAGINKIEFEKYFESKQIGYAIPITNFTIFSKPMNPKTIIPNFSPPQNFMYIADHLINPFFN